jgi:uncharacterized membrane protein YqjE
MRFSTMIAVTVVLMILGAAVCRVALREFQSARTADNKVLVEALR